MFIQCLFIDNVNSVDILCSPNEEDKNNLGFYRCARNTHFLNNVDNLYIECEEAYTCDSSLHGITNITNRASLLCDKGCKYMFILSNIADNLDISCETSEGGLFKLIIL